MASSSDALKLASQGRSNGAKTVAPARAAGWRWRTEKRSSWAFLSVPMLLYVTFIVAPLIVTVVLSMFSWDTFASPEFIGLGNFREMAKDPAVIQAFGNTFLFAVLSLVLHVTVAIALAVVTNVLVSRWLQALAKTVFFFPLLISAAAAGILWMYMLDPNYGFFNYFLGQLGIHSVPNWLLDPKTALPTLVVFDLWRTVGFQYVVVLAGLQTIPTTLYEASRIDGAGPWRQFWSITLPMLSPTILFISVVTFAGSFQIFDPMYVMTQGGPGNATLSLVQLVYYSAFRDFRLGYGSAVAVVVAVVIAMVSLIQFRVGRSRVTYDRIV